MKTSPTRLSSWLLLGGILAGFLGASWQGRLARAYSKPSNFNRFHQRISLDALYYPPYAMLETLALARWSPGKTLVIIGGNSILNGVGQPADEIWSDHLQELLGDSYVVVNLAFRAAGPVQGGALVAESLLRRGLPVIYIANTNPPAGTGRAPGGFYGYFYWQARAEDRLSAYAPRDGDIRQWLESLPPKERVQQAEQSLDARLNAFTRHQSLWHHVAYRHFFTVWHSLLARDFWVPRDRVPDNEPDAPPLNQRFRNFLPEEMRIVRSFSESLAVPDPAAQWRLEEGNRKRLNDDIEASFPPLLRPRTLMLLGECASYYLDRLTPAERERDRIVYQACAQIWRDHGIACEVAGEGFAPVDYVDRAHLSRDGGRKLADLVAAKVRQFPPP